MLMACGGAGTGTDHDAEASSPDSGSTSQGTDSSSPGTGGSKGTSSTGTETADPGENSSDTSETSVGTTSSDTENTDAATPVPGGVFVWMGSGAGGPGTDVNPTEVVEILVAAGVDTQLGEDLPVDFNERFGTLVYLNPVADFDPEVDEAAAELVASGGRLVLVMEHCMNGCWGNAPGHNALLEQLGSQLRFIGAGVSSAAPLAVTPVGPLTDGVEELMAYYTGSVEVGSATALGSAGDLAIIGWEALGPGEVVAIADGSMFGYVLGAADNQRFIENLAVHEGS